MSPGLAGSFSTTSSAGAGSMMSSSVAGSVIPGGSTNGFGFSQSGPVNTASSLLGNLGQHQLGPGLNPLVSDPSQNWMLQQLLQQQQAAHLQQQQALVLHNQKIMEEMKAAVLEAKQAARSAASVRHKTRQVSFSDSVENEAAALKAANAKQPNQCVDRIGLNMNDIRNIPGLREQVEAIMNNEVYVHPSLARGQSASTTNSAADFDSLQSVPLNTNVNAAEIIAKLRAELGLSHDSLEPHQTKHGNPAKLKSDRKMARRAAAEQREIAARAERKAAKKSAAVKLAAAKGEIRLQELLVLLMSAQHLLTQMRNLTWTRH